MLQFDFFTAIGSCFDLTISCACSSAHRFHFFTWGKGTNCFQSPRKSADHSIASFHGKSADHSMATFHGKSISRVYKFFTQFFIVFLVLGFIFFGFHFSTFELSFFKRLKIGDKQTNEQTNTLIAPYVGKLRSSDSVFFRT